MFISLRSQHILFCYVVYRVSLVLAFSQARMLQATPTTTPSAPFNVLVQPTVVPPDSAPSDEFGSALWITSDGKSTVNRKNG
jgi:hypothetical protein